VIELAGTWFDGTTSKQRSAQLKVHGNGEYRLEFDGQVKLGKFEDFELSPALGEIPRQLTLASGEVFETRDNAQLETLEKRHPSQSMLGLVDALERHWGAVLGLAASTIILVWLFLVYGVPAAARNIAFAMPVSLLVATDEQTLTVLDKLYFEESSLDKSRQQQLRERFMAATAVAEETISILFRGGGKLGANALALPGGTIIFTDEIVLLASRDEQLQAVYGHELGHLAERHAVRRVIQSSLVTIAAVLVAGDASATTDLIGAAPMVLTDLAWSREFEREADDYALSYMRDQHLSPVHFAHMMQRLECAQRAEDPLSGEREQFNSCLANEEWLEEEGGNWTSYLFSHPPSIERIQHFLNTPERAAAFE
jgi:Zn-dependent protease with chaperone function